MKKIESLLRNVELQNENLEFAASLINKVISSNSKNIFRISGVSSTLTSYNDLDVREKETMLIGLHRNNNFYALIAEIKRNVKNRHCQLNFWVEYGDNRYPLGSIEETGMSNIKNDEENSKEIIENVVVEYLEYIIK